MCFTYLVHVATLLQHKEIGYLGLLKILFIYLHLVKDKFIVVKVVNIFHFISPNSDIIKDQTKDDPMLCPPEYLWFILHNSMSCNPDVLED